VQEWSGSIVIPGRPILPAPLLVLKGEIMLKKIQIKRVKNILLTDIDIPYENMSRQSFVKILKKHKHTNWHKVKEITEGPESIKELMDSMKRVGQIECIGVTQIDVSEDLLEEDGREGVYFLRYGLRRFVAAYLLGWSRIKAVIF